MKKLIAFLFLFGGAAFAQCGGAWSTFTGSTAATNLSGAMDAKLNIRCGTTVPTALAGTAGLDAYINTANGDYYIAIATGAPATWFKVNSTGGGINSLNGLSGTTQTFTNDANVTIVSSGTAHVITWVGALAKARQHTATVYNDQANSYTAGFKQTFTSSASTAAMNFTPYAGDPSTLFDGDHWYNSSAAVFKVRIGSATRTVVTTDASGNAVFPGTVTAASYLSPPGTVFAATGLHVAASSVATPSSGNSTIFYDSSNSDKVSRKDSTGTVTVVEGGGGGSGTAAPTFTFTGASSPLVMDHNLGVSPVFWSCQDNSTPPVYFGLGAGTFTTVNRLSVAFTGTFTGKCTVTSGGTGPAGAGNNAYCPDASGSTTTYTCPSPSPTVTTLTGLVITFVPQTTNTGTATVNVAGLGAKTLKAADGTTNIAASALVGGTAYLFTYDGTNFRQGSSGGGSSGTNPFTGGGGTTYAVQGGYCNTGTATIAGGPNWTVNGNTVVALAGTSQDLVIITGLDGRLRYTHTLISEGTVFSGTSITGVKASMGRGTAGSAGGTDDEMIAQTSFMQSSGDAWYAFDRPQPPVLLSSNTYSLVLGVRTVGANVSVLTGTIHYEVCGYAVQ